TLALSGEGRLVPVVLRVSSRSAAGVEELWKAVAAQPLRHEAGLADSRDLLRLAQQTLATWFARAQRDQEAALDSLFTRWQQRQISAGEATGVLLRLLEERYAPEPTNSGAGTPISQH